MSRKNGYTGPSPMKHTETWIKQKEIMRLRQDGMSFPEIGEKMGHSQGYVYKLYKQAMREFIVEDVEQVRRLELQRLDELEREARNVLRSFHPVLAQGMVVRDVLEDKDGNPILNEDETPVTFKLKDTAPVLNSIDRLLKISERRARLLGLDKPVKTSITTPDGEKEASMVQFYLPSNGRDTSVDNG